MVGQGVMLLAFSLVRFGVGVFVGPLGLVMVKALGIRGCTRSMRKIWGLLLSLGVISRSGYSPSPRI